MKRSVILLAVLAATHLLAQDRPPVPGPIPLPPVPATASAAASLWRRVLAMTDQERELFIQSKPAAWQTCLRVKVQEYLALAPAERDARLAALELRALMLPLMKMSPAPRAKQMESLPEGKRKEIEQRLMTWDILPPPLQKDLLENEAAMHLVVQAGGTNLSREKLLAGVLPQSRAQAEKQLDSWNSLPEQRREQMMSSFKRFFVEPQQTRLTAMRQLRPEERTAVAQLEKLPEQQRDQALEGFKKFKRLHPAEQQEFLRAAARWQGMSEGDRQLWRHLAPDLRRRLATPPPMPPPPMPRPARLSAATN